MSDKGVPKQVPVQISEKGKQKEMWVAIKSQGVDFLLEISESKVSWRPKSVVKLKQVISELKSPGSPVLLIITTDQEIALTFKSASDAQTYHNFIYDKSEVQADNNAIAQLDDEMRLIWPFPGGSFF